VLEAVGGVIWLLAAKGLFDLVDYRNYWFGDGGNFQILAIVAAAAGVAGFALAWGFWMVRPWAWTLGAALCIVAAAIAALSLAGGGNAVTGVLNVAIQVGVLLYLNLNSVRALFGRPPTTLLQFGGPVGPR
jgi:hypothetical protein